MSEPLLSVITPVFNCEEYIIRSLLSLSVQCAPGEYLIEDDGSTDDTPKIVQRFINMRPSKPFRFTLGETNLRIPRRRNRMIKELARGKYIAIHDGDDVSLSFRLKSQIEFLESHPDVFCVGGWAKKIDLEGNSILDEDGNQKLMDYPPASHDEIVDMIRGQCMNPMIDPTTMFRRDDFLELNGYSVEEEIYTVPDFDLWIRAINSGKKFANIQLPLIEYRTNPNGMTGKHKKEMIAAHMVVWSRFMGNKDRHYKALELCHLGIIKRLKESIDANTE